MAIAGWPTASRGTPASCFRASRRAVAESLEELSLERLQAFDVAVFRRLEGPIEAKDERASQAAQEDDRRVEAVMRARAAFVLAAEVPPQQHRQRVAPRGTS